MRLVVALFAGTAVCAFAGAVKPARARLVALPEFVRPDPFGGIVAPDRRSGAAPLTAISLRGARGGYVSFHLAVEVPEGGEYTLSLEPPGGGVEAEVYREWFHFTDADKHYYPDALIPVTLPYKSKLPDAENRIDKQTVAAFWVDLWIPPKARPWVSHFEARLETGQGRSTVPIDLSVLEPVIPATDPVTMDHNAYGTSFIDAPYLSDEFFAQIHAYHRIFYEHRGAFHDLGYGHAGKVGPEFAPALEGSGRKKHVSDWSLFDRHYGPLFDGTAFQRTHRGPAPVPYAYLPINPEWPASFLWWGEPGYAAEFVNVVSEMERHFREKGWTRTTLEVFFNHKVRYKGFPWDGDECRFPEDLAYFAEYAALMKKAVPADSPVQFRMRADVSWMMEEQFQKLAGVVRFWVAGGSELSWYPDAPQKLKARGDIVWMYGGTPELSKVSTSMTLNPMKAWIRGTDGYVHWLSVSPGDDPWFHFDGGGTALVYPGKKFGIAGPIPSVRLKLERNCVQDLALLVSAAPGAQLAAARVEAARRFNGTSLKEWVTPRPAFADRPARDWTNADIEEATAATDARLAQIDSGSWDKVRQFVYTLGAEASQ